MTEEEGDREYDSGPFCRHFSDPSDCSEPCVMCGHPCREHPSDGGCSGETCLCPAFMGEGA